KPFAISPFLIDGDRSSGTLRGIDSTAPGPEGSGDDRTQAYNFRFCLTDVKENQIAITKPANYDPRLYELVARFIAQNPDARPGPQLFKLSGMPNCKTDSNNQG